MCHVWYWMLCKRRELWVFVLIYDWHGIWRISRRFVKIETCLVLNELDFVKLICLQLNLKWSDLCFDFFILKASLMYSLVWIFQLNSKAIFSSLLAKQRFGGKINFNFKQSNIILLCKTMFSSIKFDFEGCKWFSNHAIIRGIWLTLIICAVGLAYGAVIYSVVFWFGHLCCL